MTKSLKLRVYITIVCISFLQGLQYGPSPVLKQIGEHFPNVSTSVVQMLITGPSLIGMVFALASGVLVVRISKKKLLLISSLISGIFGVLPLIADSFPLLFGSRMIYGVALGLATALNTAVVAEWFTGNERVTAMGIQAASVGAGMAVTMKGAGSLGAAVFTNSYFINIIGFICFALILICLPESGKAVQSEGNRITVNSRVIVVAVLGLLEFMFLISYTTNISMHLEGSLAGNSVVSGNLTSIFSIAQIVIGLVLGVITKVTKRATMPVAMCSFVLGAVVLVLFPANFAMQCVGALLCGFSQGVFIPTAMVEVSNAVPPVAAAMASGIFTCGTCTGQLISPFVLNTAAKVFMGEATTSNVYKIAAVGMAISAVFCAAVMFGGKKGQAGQ